MASDKCQRTATARRRKRESSPKGGSINDLDRERLSVVQLALLDPLEQVFTGQLRVHAREVGVGPLGRAGHERVETLESPLDRHGRVQKLDRGCEGQP
ncbi:hypothetical protein C8Q76DRAFT_727621 [Earliella scabrosa]|nr:hypothetical protein C8Q76DRAFT_727621 [Earliella scabrosa]